jgi:hypothetical protein
MIYHVTYANDEMTKSAILAQNSALKHGCDRSFIMNEKSFSSEFLKLNEEILKQDRGAGYWIWKPYVIFNMLNKISENDILVYTDAGIEIINDINHLINKMDQDVFLFGNNYPHIEWCKADVMDGILQNWELEFDVNNRQAQASVLIVKNTEASRIFIGKWLKYCQIDHFIDDSKSYEKNYIYFAEHRHDQAVLTCLAYKYGINLHWWPAHYNGGQFVYDKHPQFNEDNYPVIFHHHRKRNNEW